MARRGDGGQRIHAVVVALQRPAHPALNLPVEHDVEAVVIAKIGNGPACAVFRTEKLGFRPASACKYALQAVFPAVDQQAALTGNGAHEMVELRLDSGKIGKDVRVIELEIVQNGRTGTVMDELAALVEEGRVVFVGLDDEEIGRRQPRRQPEVARHAAHQEARVIAGVLQNPGEHRRGGRLAVCAGYSEHPLLPQHIVAQPLRPRDIGQVAVEDGFHQRVAPRDHIANHIQIGTDRQLRRIEALDQLDPLGFELGAHRRVDVGVAAGDAVPGLAGDEGDPAHEGAADSKDVDMHGSHLNYVARHCTRWLRRCRDRFPGHAGGGRRRPVQ